MNTPSRDYYVSEISDVTAELRQPMSAVERTNLIADLHGLRSQVARMTPEFEIEEQLFYRALGNA